jgi:hypothetical protein
MPKIDHNIGLQEKRRFLAENWHCRKLWSLNWPRKNILYTCTRLVRSSLPISTFLTPEIYFCISIFSILYSNYVKKYVINTLIFDYVFTPEIYFCISIFSIMYSNYVKKYVTNTLFFYYKPVPQRYSISRPIPQSNALISY